ncbi:MAG: HAMP domain-containing sensor histidine kinase [bacterium]|nr:HAMP domain-containing sensor histidine kinase [bacterium]
MVIGIGAITLIATAVLVAPGLFHNHLGAAGVDNPEVRMHAEEAFASSFAISVAVATGVSLLAAGLVSWFLVRRVARPVEELAAATRTVAAGHYEVSVPDAEFSSELHELSESFAHMAHQLSEADAARVRLLANLAHELRTPLATLEGFIDGMEDGILPVDAPSWSTMRDQVDRLRRLSVDLRETAAAEEHALTMVYERLDARSVSSAVVFAASPRYRNKGVELRSAESGDPCWILGDKVRLQQVIANLLDNALRHTDKDGLVTVTTERTGDDIIIAVADDGDGIPNEQLTKVFERFHRVDPSRGTVDGSGSGLGLTIARAIVREHGGEVIARSAGNGLGATFVVSLPAVTPSR